MSERRRRKRYYLDAGDGITLATTLRSPPDPETVKALKALASAAARHLDAHVPPAAATDDPPGSSPSTAPGSPGATQEPGE